MKRIAVLTLLGLVVLSAGAFAAKGTPDLAIGGELTSVNFGGVGSMLTLHVPKVPLFFGIGADFIGGFRLAMTVDYWLLHGNIASIFDYYLGVGGYGALSFDPTWFGVGARVPLGIQAWPLQNEILEIFLEVAPAWVPITSDGFSAGNFQAQLALGFRLWF